MCLQAQPPPGVIEAVSDAELRVLLSLGAIHWLEEEVLKVQSFEELRLCTRLRVHELELFSCLYLQPGSGLGTHADPGDSPGR